MPNRIQFTVEVQAKDYATAIRLLTVLADKAEDSESVEAVWQLSRIVVQSTRVGIVTTDGGAL